MADDNPDIPDDEEEEPALPKRRMKADTEMDMTPMIDCTFLLLVFFVVGAKIDPDTAVQLPPARYGTGVDPTKAVVISIAQPAGATEPQVFLADSKDATPLPADADAQAAEIKAAVEAGVIDGRTNILIKAERGVKHREVARIAAAASQYEGVTLNVAVMEVGASE
jgi:biopolymer transport protein ExbD